MSTNNTTITDTPVTNGASDLTVVESEVNRAGSPQAARGSPFDDDDDDDLEVHPAVTSTTTTTPATTVPSTTAPVVPQVIPANNQAVSEREAKVAILTEAFPTVDKEVCEFVLESHRGNVEASINALLEISDPEFHADPAPAPAAAPAPTPALPRRESGQNADGLSGDMANMNLNRPQQEIDPILLASTSTPEQQLRSDEDFARTLAAMDEYRARNDRQDGRQPGQQQGQEGPSFTTELRELMDELLRRDIKEELPKIKERFNVAADTTKKKVNEWYTQFKNNRAEAAQRQQAANEGRYNDNYRNLPNNDEWSVSNDRDPIRFGAHDADEPLARNRVTPPLDNSANPPLPARATPYNVGTTVADSTHDAPRRTTVEDEREFAVNFGPVRR